MSGSVDTGELTRDRIEGAIARASHYIDHQLGQDGLWRDFTTLAGVASEWTTGFVFFHRFAGRFEPLAGYEILRRLMRIQRRGGGWGYNAAVPPDSDSTAWCLLAIALGAQWRGAQWRPSAVYRARRYLQTHHRSEDGGFATYELSDGIERFIGASSAERTIGWRSSHVCVSAAALQALLAHGEGLSSEIVRRTTRFIEASLQSAPVRSYWWVGTAYPTYQCLRALAVGGALTRALLDRIRSILAETMRSGGYWSGDREQASVFETAFNLLSLSVYPGDRGIVDRASRAAAWLVDGQGPDGSWPAETILRIPPPQVRNADEVEEWRSGGLGTGTVLKDQNHLFTTASALRALYRFRLQHAN